MGAAKFSNHFSDDGSSNIEDQLKVIKLFLTYLSKEDKDLFLSDFSLSKIEGILKGFKKHKSPGPDGWPVEFYIHFFDLVGQDILNAVTQSRSEGKVSGALNATFITLIPKCDNPISFPNYMPFSLCNLVYKVFSKLATIRLKPILDRAISRNQFGFLHQRQIIEPIGFAQEFMHSIKVEKKKAIILKLDLVKAFDRVNWTFF